MDAATWTGIIVALILGCAVVLSPIFIAKYRRTDNVGQVAVVTVLLSWTFIGWIVALVMALSNKHKRAPSA